MKAVVAQLQHVQPVSISSGTRMYLEPEHDDLVGAREELLKTLGTCASGSVVPLLLEEVELSASCIAGLLGPVLKRVATSESSGRYVIGIDPSGRNAWDADAGLKKMSATLDEKLVCVWVEAEHEIRLVGAVDPQVETTYHFVLGEGSDDGVTARDLAEYFQLSIQAASNRLTKAAGLGILHRIQTRPVQATGGRENVYVPVR